MIDTWRTLPAFDDNMPVYENSNDWIFEERIIEYWIQEDDEDEDIYRYVGEVN